MITFKHIIILLVILEIFIYTLVNVCKAISPDNPKPLTAAEINTIIKNCPNCAAPMYEAGIIEPNN